LRSSAWGQADAEEIATWRYSGEYAFYDSDADPGDVAELLDADRRAGMYFSARDKHRALVGFFQFKRTESGAVEIGLGLRPELTGRGLGRRFVEEGLEFASQRFGAATFMLAVAAFNTRAIRVYERCGFGEVRRTTRHTGSGDWEFVAMERTA